MLKIILAALLVTICALIGFAVERVYKTRLKMLEEYREFIRYAERETEFLKTDIKALLTQFECNEELKRIFRDIADCLERGATLDIGSKYASDVAVKEMCTFINNLASSDYHGKNAVIKHALGVAEVMTAKAEKEKSQKGELVRKLMILLGVGLVVIIL